MIEEKCEHPLGSRVLTMIVFANGIDRLRDRHQFYCRDCGEHFWENEVRDK